MTPDATRAVAHDGNQTFWAQEGPARFYAGRSDLYAPERRILSRIAADCHQRPILDLGVGTGRTTAALLAISADYLGVDYSCAMLERCRERFPDVAFHEADVRDLRKLPERHYGLVMFSFNGLDYISHNERVATLRRIRTLLASDGWFVFSTHNRLAEVRSPWDLQHLSSGPLKKLPGRLWAYMQGIAAYSGKRSHAYESVDHAVRIDGAFNYGVTTYYMAPLDQQAQLEATGFALLDTYDMSGNRVDVRDALRDPWLYYLAHGVQ